MRYLTDALYLIMGLSLLPMVLYRRLRHQRYRQGWGQRFGFLADRSARRPCVWIHAVSVGEANAARAIVDRLQQDFPSHAVVVSSTTDTGYARAQALFASVCEVIHFPLDLSWVMSRAFRKLNPCLCLLMELEVWPNYIATAKRRQIPVAVVNGRISDRSYRTYCRFRRMLHPSFARLDLALVQTEAYARRFIHLGCPETHVKVTGSLKYDTAQITDRLEGTEAIARELQFTDHDRIWVAGGTGDGEEALILSAYRRLIEDASLSDLRLVLVPRKPERFEPVAQQIAAAEFPLQRYSTVKGAAPAAGSPRQAVILGDTMGDLRRFYALSTVVFVGRSLVPMGGSDMMEAAALGKPTLFGPHTQNFRQTVCDLLEQEGAVEVQDVDALVAAVRRCLLDPEYARTLGEKGQTVIRRNQGATDQTMRHLRELLQ
jgi:3-deoxy-D-manno-octulosonic-acid transferase